MFVRESVTAVTVTAAVPVLPKIHGTVKVVKKARGGWLLGKSAVGKVPKSD